MAELTGLVSQKCIGMRRRARVDTRFGFDRQGEEPNLPTLSILTDFSLPNL